MAEKKKNIILKILFVLNAAALLLVPALSSCSRVNRDPADTESYVIHDFGPDDGDYYTVPSVDMVTVSATESGVVITGEGAYLESGTVYIRKPGTYMFTGSFGNTAVDADCEGALRFVFSGAQFSSDSEVMKIVASKFVLSLDKGTSNKIKGYMTPVVSSCEMTVNGTGSLEIICSKDAFAIDTKGLLIMDGNIYIASENRGIKSKDYFCMEKGYLTVNSAYDAIYAERSERAEANIYIDNGNLSLNTGSSSIDIPDSIEISGGILNIKSEEQTAFKCAKISVKNASLTVSAAEDGMDISNTAEISGSNVSVACKGRAIICQSLSSADSNLFVLDSRTGLVCDEVTADGGEINIVSAEECISGKTVSLTSAKALFRTGGIVFGEEITSASFTKCDSEIYCSNISGKDILSVTGGVFTVLSEKKIPAVKTGMYCISLEEGVITRPLVIYTKDGKDVFRQYLFDGSFAYFICLADVFGEGERYDMEIGGSIMSLPTG